MLSKYRYIKITRVISFAQTVNVEKLIIFLKGSQGIKEIFLYL